MKKFKTKKQYTLESVDEWDFSEISVSYLLASMHGIDCYSVTINLIVVDTPDSERIEYEVCVNEQSKRVSRRSMIKPTLLELIDAQ
ncbi:hypothetical protein [Marisediminitalea sp.]|uniref:hypothetical protein n=1 Tax=Marisediminitalea sp. TaxID=2662268 RepID=UPI003511EF2C